MGSNWDLKSYHMVLDIWTHKSSGVNQTTCASTCASTQTTFVQEVRFITSLNI